MVIIILAAKDAKQEFALTVWFPLKPFHRFRAKLPGIMGLGPRGAGNLYTEVSCIR